MQSSHTYQFSRLTALAISIGLLSACSSNDASPPTPAAHASPTIVGRAILPAATFADGPSSGHYLGGNTNGQTLPFDKQPVQGFSATLRNDDGTFLAMTDNGYGTIENSADFYLRVYTIRPDFKRQTGGAGGIKVESFISLQDPNNLIPFTITNQFSTDRLLTGADFDIESMQRTRDGTLWFGDEFGPFLLHTDKNGVLLEAPIPLPDSENPGKFIRSPQNPYNEESSALRIMNAVRAHAQRFGATRAPVFSPYNVQLKYDVNGVKSSADAHYARGTNPQPGLMPATSEVFDVASLKSAGYPVITWTVNEKARMLELMKAGVTGIISDRSDLLLQAVQEFDANNDGVPGDFLLPDGRIDASKFDAQGHRGSRNLRPENTLPAYEVALDNLMTTLETDAGISKDGIAVIKHDPYIEAQKCRRADNAPYTFADEALIKNLTVAQIQATFICDKVFRGPEQLNDPALSPVSVQVAAAKGYISPYVMPKAQDMFDLVSAYITYYSTGAGAAHPDAGKRIANAKIVRFNIETKLNPRSDTDNHGNVYRERTVGVTPMADTLAGLIVANGMQARADIQSFDFRTLLGVQEKFPAIRTVYLFGDFPIYPNPASDDGTNMQDEGGRNTPWMSGLYWPYRSTATSMPFRAKQSGGFEGMALSSDGNKLYPMLEQPLTDHDGKTLLISEFDIASRSYTGKQFKYKVEEKASNIGDFQLYNANEGIVIERDNSQGDLKGFKKLFQIKLGKQGEYVTKTELVDLLSMKDPYRITSPLNGDIGLGDTLFHALQYNRERCGD
ncbi:esterase-like activity of phytase family protein [Chitinimonas sp. BJB300]|uniref:esterase-like activity of phytase family protein n=1 Tax=Chitinimonas sp. BJB300 TaxID=1559339 RepID=UPI001E3F468E|nr:esterase-like activity of phytase family protein [Chitinimonas sp. BJB300]